MSAEPIEATPIVAKKKKAKKASWTAKRRKMFSATMKAMREGKERPLTKEVLQLREKGLDVHQISKRLKISPQAVKDRIEAKKVMHIPAAAIPMPEARPVRTRAPARRAQSSSALRIVLPAGTEIVATINGVEVTIVAGTK